MDDAAALAGLKVIVAGGELGAVKPVRDRLAALGAEAAALVGDAEELARAVAASPPGAILADAVTEQPLRERLDPMGLEAGPPVIAIAPGDEQLTAAAAARLRAFVERRSLLARQAELGALVAASALTRAREARNAEYEVLDRLLQAAGYRDDNTFEHTQRVGSLSARIARGMGLDDHHVALIQRTAPLHDLGKIAIPDSILLKPGRLTEEEFEVIKTHAVLGARVLSGGGSELLATAEAIARHHHERWDGGGYPYGLDGERIPVAARIVRVADVYDVLVHERPYRESLSTEAAAEEIARGAGSEFDPAAVEVFKNLALQV